jgi:hypothetical protein
LGSAFGLAAIAFRCRGLSPINRVIWAGIELFKAWAIIVLNVYWGASFLLRQRSHAITSGERQKFGDILARIIDKSAER